MAGQNPRYIPGYLDTQTGQFVQQIPQQQQQQQQQSSNRIPSNQIMAGGRNNGQFVQYGQPIQQPVNYNFPVADNMMPPYAPTQQVPSAVRYEYMPNSRGEFVPVRTYNYNPQYSTYSGSRAPVAITQSGKIPAITQTAKRTVTPQTRVSPEPVYTQQGAIQAANEGWVDNPTAQERTNNAIQAANEGWVDNPTAQERTNNAIQAANEGWVDNPTAQELSGIQEIGFRRIQGREPAWHERAGMAIMDYGLPLAERIYYRLTDPQPYTQRQPWMTDEFWQDNLVKLAEWNKRHGVTE